MTPDCRINFQIFPAWCGRGQDYNTASTRIEPLTIVFSKLNYGTVQVPKAIMLNTYQEP